MNLLEEADLASAVAEYRAESRAPATRRAYAADFDDFQSFCVRMGMAPIPASADLVAKYLVARAKTLSVSTLNRRLAAIRAAHRDEGVAPPIGPVLHETWSGIRRTHGRPPRQKRALVVKDLKRAVNALPDTLKGKRDRALLLLGFATGLRRSELVALDLDGPGAGLQRVAFVAEGLEVTIGKSKADQEGRGATIAVAYAGDHCAVRAVESWLKASGIRAGALFRGVSKSGALQADRLCDRAVALVVKEAAARVGLPPEALAGHSLRSGLVTTLAEKGAPLDEIMETSRHSKVETVLRYVRSAKRFKRSAATRAGL